MNKDKQTFQFDEKRIQELLQEQAKLDPDEVGSPPGGKKSEQTIDDIRFETTPEELINYLKGYIVGQEQAIDVVATKICTHFHRMQLERERPDLPKIVGHVKSNMLLIGPTGVGKTYLIRLIANKLKVPFVKGDATKFSETGYVGGDVEDLVRELVHQAGDSISLAEFGIIYIDEIDKIASNGYGWSGPDVSRGGVQRNLLKLMEETEVDMKVPHDLASQMEAVMETQRTGKATRKKVNTRNILFVMSGAFVNLPEIIGRRLKKGGMGFTGETMTSIEDVSYLLPRMHARDLMEFGFESEFVGRLPVVTYLSDLDEDGLYGILKNPNSAVIQGKRRDFAAYGIRLDFEDEALRLIAHEAAKLKIGARGLVSIIEKLLLPYERSLPTTGVRNLMISMDLCLNPQKNLTELINSHGFESFVANFIKRTSITLVISPTAKEYISEQATLKKQTIPQFLTDTLQNYEYGLKLAGITNFNITKNVVADSKGYLEKLIKKNYRPHDN